MRGPAEELPLPGRMTDPGSLKQRPTRGVRSCFGTELAKRKLNYVTMFFEMVGLSAKSSHKQRDSDFPL